jgi:hypothetical protein
MHAHVQGEAILTCNQRGDSKLQGCAVKSGYPRGYGFGAAALKLAPQLGARGGCADHNPLGIVHRGVDTPVHFKLAS